jgi:hypothetical protein
MQAAAAAAVVVVVVVVVVQLHTLSGVCAKPRWMALQASNKYDATNVEGWNGRRVLSLAWSAVPSAANSAGSAIEVAHTSETSQVMSDAHEMHTYFPMFVCATSSIAMLHYATQSRVHVPEIASPMKPTVYWQRRFLHAQQPSAIPTVHSLQQPCSTCVSRYGTH